MPLWGATKAGANVDSRLNWTDLRGGDDFALLDGTETVATGSKSVPFARGYVPGGNLGRTYQISGCSGGTVITVQGSNGVSASDTTPTVTPTFANMDLSFNSVGLAQTGNGALTDQGSSAFYRVIVTTFVSGDIPVVIVKCG